MNYQDKRTYMNIVAKASIEMVLTERNGGDYIDQLSNAVAYFGDDIFIYSIWDQLMQAESYVDELVRKCEALK